MQRSIGKKILAVAVGAGIALGGLAVGPAAADNHWPKPGQELDICADTPWVCNPPTNKPEVDGGDGNVDPPKDGGNVDESLPSVINEPVSVASPCWGQTGNCPVGGAIQTAVPQYMIAGLPQKVVVYASWRPDANSEAQPTNGTAVIQMDGEDIAAAPFEDGVAIFSFTPTVPGLKEVKISGVVSSGLSGQAAYIDTVDAATMVLPYDPALLGEALKNKKVEVGDTYTLEEIAQAKTALGKRLKWRVDQDSKDVCAVTTTKKGEVRAKFTESGKCSIIWTDPKKDEEGKYTFKVTA